MCLTTVASRGNVTTAEFYFFPACVSTECAPAQFIKCCVSELAQKEASIVDSIRNRNMKNSDAPTTTPMTPINMFDVILYTAFSYVMLQKASDVCNFLLDPDR
ncbi:unnamed protein product [Caenorhabditis brenneri]